MTRTRDLLITNQLLYRLSYSSGYNCHGRHCTMFPPFCQSPHRLFLLRQIIRYVIALSLFVKISPVKRPGSEPLIFFRQNAQRKLGEEPWKRRRFSHFSPPFFFRHFLSSFDIILFLIMHYKELFTFSTDFSTRQKASISNGFPPFCQKIPQAAKQSSHRLDTRIFVDIIFLFVEFYTDNFFSLTIIILYH